MAFTLPFHLKCRHHEVACKIEIQKVIKGNLHLGENKNSGKEPGAMEDTGRGNDDVS